MSHRSTFCILVICLATSTRAALLQFRPLTSQQVYRALRESGREDAVPQGRVITEGIAAMTGFALGIAKGIGIPLIFNIDLANVTGVLGNSNSNSNSAAVTPMSTQEICFNTRSLNEIDDNDADEDDNDDNEDEFNENYYKSKRVRVREGRARRNENTENETATAPTAIDDDDNEARTGTSSSPASAYSSPSRKLISGTQTNTNTATTADAGSGTGSNTETTTQTGTGGAVNCVVIQKPTRK